MISLDLVGLVSKVLNKDELDENDALADADKGENVNSIANEDVNVDVCEECEFEVWNHEDHQYCSWLVCVVCSDEAPNKGALEQHKKDAHGTDFEADENSKEEEHLCICGFEAKSKDEIVAHEVVACIACGEMFRSRRNVEKHQEKEHRDGPRFYPDSGF